MLFYNIHKQSNIGNVKIENNTWGKLLGIKVDNKLNFKEDLNWIFKKTNCMSSVGLSNLIGQMWEVFTVWNRKYFLSWSENMENHFKSIHEEKIKCAERLIKNFSKNKRNCFPLFFCFYIWVLKSFINNLVYYCI